jgi:hypothetical protein
MRNNARTMMGVAKAHQIRKLLIKFLQIFLSEKALYYEERNLVNKYL